MSHELRFPMRINQFLAHCGICARRKAETYILAGKVQINKEIVKDLSRKVQATDQVLFKNRPIQPIQYDYLLLNKPKNFICTKHDTLDRQTAQSLLGAKYRHLSSVGRLDRNSTGLLLFTNDGGLAQKLSHPTYGISKLYEVGLAKPLSEKTLKTLRKQGVQLSDGCFRPDKIELIEDNIGYKIGVQLHDGKNRVIRRMFEAVGHKILTLDRVMYGPLTKKHLPRGNYRALSANEIRLIKHFT